MELARQKDEGELLKEETRLAQAIAKERELVRIYFTVVTQSLLASNIKITEPPTQLFAAISLATLVVYLFLFSLWKIIVRTTLFWL